MPEGIDPTGKPDKAKPGWLPKGHSTYQAPKTANDLKCPHGVQFYDVVDAARRSDRAAWSYEAPLEKMKPVDHWIGFWEDVEIK